MQRLVCALQCHSPQPTLPTALPTSRYYTYSFQAGTAYSVQYSLYSTGFSDVAVVCIGSQGCTVVTATGRSALLTQGSAVVCAAAALLLFPAWLCAAVAAIRLRGATLGIRPPSSCLVSLPAIQALTWAGTAALAAGAAVNYREYDALAAAMEAAGAVSPYGSPGRAYLAAALTCTATAALLLTVAGCCIGHLPGLGCSTTCCSCCGETVASRASSSRATAPSPGGAPAGLAAPMPVPMRAALAFQTLLGEA